jgi:hypothetical protein
MAQNTPPPIPTQSPMLTDGGLVSRVWIAWFTYLKGIFGFNQTVYANGEAQPQELGLNFDDSFTVTDDPTNGFTTIGLAPAAYSVQNGEVCVPPTGTNSTSIPVIFDKPFTTIPRVVATPNGFARGTPDPISVMITNKTKAGFTIYLITSVPVGGGGSTFDIPVPCDWIAIA